MIKWLLVFVLTGLLGFAFQPLSAQSNSDPIILKGRVLQADSSALPFVFVTDSAGNFKTISDTDGFFSLPADSAISICLSHPEYAVKCFSVSAISSDTVLFVLQQERPLLWLKPDRTATVLQKVLKAAPNQNPSNQKGFSYQAYNKLTVSLHDNPFRKNAPFFLPKILPFLNASSKGEHHLFLSESVTKREFDQDKKDRETILASKSSGVENASYASLATQYQFFSIFDEYIKLANYTFVGPFTPKTSQHYDFLVTDLFAVEADTVFVLRFEPKPKSSFEGLAGYVYVKGKTGEITHVLARYANRKNPDIRIYQHLKSIDNKVRFPEITRSSIGFRKIGSRKKQIQADFTSVLSDTKIQPENTPEKFDEIWINVNPDAENLPEIFWNAQRKLPYTIQDKQTETYFDSTGKLNDLEQYITFVEKLKTGTIPYKFLDVKLRYLLSHNDYEGIRIGFGVETNEQLFEKLSLLGYVGYGFEDNGFKYGTGATYYLDNYRQNSLSFLHREDVEESGAVFFPFDRKQFSSEHIRKFLVNKMNLYTENRLSYENNSLKHLSFITYLSSNKKTPSFTYFYKGQPDLGARYFDAVLGVRFGYQEKYIQTQSRKISIHNERPVISFLFTKGFENVLDSDFGYTKADAKFENSWRTFPIGITTVQLIGGKVFGRVPYANLYNGKGSLKVPSVVIHNSFETMHYNEFLSSEYAALFASHNFGKWLLQKDGFQPSLELIHNMGWGNLEHAEDFKTDNNLPFKTMEKGYFESGFFLNDLFVFRSPLIDTGIGAGFFFRYGPYAQDKTGDNIFFKFSAYVIL